MADDKVIDTESKGGTEKMDDIEFDVMDSVRYKAETDEAESTQETIDEADAKRAEKFMEEHKISINGDTAQGRVTVERNSLKAVKRGKTKASRVEGTLMASYTAGVLSVIVESDGVAYSVNLDDVFAIANATIEAYRRITTPMRKEDIPQEGKEEENGETAGKTDTE